MIAASVSAYFNLFSSSLFSLYFTLSICLHTPAVAAAVKIATELLNLILFSSLFLSSKRRENFVG